ALSVCHSLRCAPSRQRSIRKWLWRCRSDNPPTLSHCWRRRYFNALAATSAFMSSIAANRSNALAWPNRPVHLVVPTVRDCPDCRPRLSKGWGQQVLIESRPGGGTNIGVPPSAWPTRHTLLSPVPWRSMATSPKGELPCSTVDALHRFLGPRRSPALPRQRGSRVHSRKAQRRRCREEIISSRTAR